MNEIFSISLQYLLDLTTADIGHNTDIIFMSQLSSCQMEDNTGIKCV